MQIREKKQNFFDFHKTTYYLEGHQFPSFQSTTTVKNTINLADPFEFWNKTNNTYATHTYISVEIYHYPKNC